MLLVGILMVVLLVPCLSKRVFISGGLVSFKDFFHDAKHILDHGLVQKVPLKPLIRPIVDRSVWVLLLRPLSQHELLEDSFLLLFLRQLRVAKVLALPVASGITNLSANFSSSFVLIL